MISYLGDFSEDATVYIMFNTFSSDDPSASCTITNFVNTDVHIHKDDGLTQRNNAAGITVSVDFDGITGSHMVKIDTSDNTVAGFWVVGHEYFVRIEGTTIDGATINSVIGQFSIENRYNEVDVVKWLGTAAATPTVAGVPEVDMTHMVGDTQSAIDLKEFADDCYSTITKSVISNLGYMIGSSQSVLDLRDFANDGYNPVDHKIQGVVLVDTTTTNTDMVGTDNAALAATALTDVTWTDAKAAFIDHSIATVDTNIDTLLARITAARAGYLDNLSAGAVALAAGVDVTQWLGTAVTANVAGQPTVDVTRLGAQTAALIDLVDFASNGYDSTNNVVFSDLVYIHGSALTETAGQLAAGFTKLFDVATPLLVASDVMRGTDSAYTGTPPTAAAIVNEWETQSQADPTGFHVNVLEIGGTAQTANDNGADINAILGDTNELQGDWTNTGRLDTILDTIAADTTTDIPALIADVPTVAEFEARSIAAADYVVTTDTIAGVTTATNLTNAPTNGDLTATMKTSVNTEAKDVLTVDTIADSYATDGNQPTIAQAILAIQQFAQEKSISGTTLTVKKPDGSTTAMTFTLDHATEPTSLTRAT